MHKFAMILLLMSVPLMAQWPKHEDPVLPRTADGKPDLSAPAPRAADGKPDLSGVWVVTNGSFYLTWDLKSEEMLPWAAALYKEREANFRRDTDGIQCLPPGPKAAIGVGGLPIKVIQNPGLVVILHEYQTLFRQIFTDGRALPEDPNPTWMGYSVGHWEGDTLVVTTAGFNDKTTIDLAGHPHTEALRTTERFHRRDIGHMDVQFTFDDPKAYTRPWTLPMEFALLPEQDLIEYVCENEKDAIHLVGNSGKEFQISADGLARYVGTYQVGARVAKVSLDDGRLMVAEGQSGKIPLVAQSETSFTMEGTGVEFLKDEKGAVSAMIEHWVEGDRKYVRLDRR
jgi:hypothetical protein